MRLIDVEKLENDIVENITVKAVSRVLAITQGQPTVKAIPIEWIKNVWLKKPENQGDIEFFPPATFEVVMNWLIEDWEKENE